MSTQPRMPMRSREVVDERPEAHALHDAGHADRQRSASRSAPVRCPSATNRLFMSTNSRYAWSSSSMACAAMLRVHRLPRSVERRVVDERVARLAHVAPAVREVAEAELGARRPRTRRPVSCGKSLRDAHADRAVAVEDRAADGQVGAVAHEDAVEDVLEDRLEERGDEDDDDLVLALARGSARMRVSRRRSRSVGYVARAVAARGAADAGRACGRRAKRGVVEERAAGRALPVRRRPSRGPRLRFGLRASSCGHRITVSAATQRVRGGSSPCAVEQRLVGEQLGRGPVGDDAAAVDDDRPVAQLGGDVHVVGRDHERRVQRREQLDHPAPRARVEVAGRLVEHEQARATSTAPWRARPACAARSSGAGRPGSPPRRARRRAAPRGRGGPPRPAAGPC